VVDGCEEKAPSVANSLTSLSPESMDLFNSIHTLLNYYKALIFKSLSLSLSISRERERERERVSLLGSPAQRFVFGEMTSVALSPILECGHLSHFERERDGDACWSSANQTRGSCRP